MGTLELFRDPRELAHSLAKDRQFDETRGFWIVGYVAIGLAVATAIQCHVVTGQSGELTHWIPSLVYGCLLWFWWAAVSISLWALGQTRVRIWVMSWSNAFLQLVFGLFIGSGHLAFLGVAIHLMVLRWPYLKPVGYETLASFTPEHLSLETLLYVIIWAASAAFYGQVTRQKETLQSALLKEQLSAAHLRALQMQIEPHFLLNTLNAITALVEDGSQREAAETLSHLNEILKTTLVRESPEKVSLAQELSLVKHYLAIEQIRFADRLRIEMSVDPEALDSKIPCFLLQPIVENAIRHGISTIEGEGVVATSVVRKGEVLHLSVRDNGTGSGDAASRGHGIGLRNTGDRLEYFYPANHEFLWGRGSTGGFEVSIKIPYERL